MYAPARGDTFERFVKLAADRFETSVQNKYDQHVWDLHCKVSDIIIREIEEILLKDL